MQLDNAPGPPKWIRILILLVCLGMSAFLLWHNYQGDGRFQNGGLLTGIFLLSLFVLASTGVLQFPPGFNIPFFEVWPRLPDLAKAVGFFVLIFLWTPIAKQLVPETPVGAVLVLGPDVAFLLTALVYLSNGLSVK
jgi:hypothetical protein